MNPVGTLQLVLLAAIAFCAIASLVVSTLLPFIVRRSEHSAPASRHLALVLVAFAPLALTLVALVAVTWPSLSAMMGSGHDHCLLHDDGHPHLCFVHLSEHSGGFLGWSMVAGVGAWLGAKIFAGAGAVLKASRLLEELSRSARESPDGNARVIPTESLLCFSAGVLHPWLVVSEGLLAAASADELQVMLAHEAAHLRRRDTLVRLLVRGASLPLLPPARRMLLGALELSAERACDEEAAHRVGDRLRVAETILTMERLSSSGHAPPTLLASSFGVSAVPERVEAMLLPPRNAGAFAPLGVALALAAAGLLLVSEPLHHITESALAFLSH